MSGADRATGRRSSGSAVLEKTELAARIYLSSTLVDADTAAIPERLKRVGYLSKGCYVVDLARATDEAPFARAEWIVPALQPRVTGQYPIDLINPEKCPVTILERKTRVADPNRYDAKSLHPGEVQFKHDVDFKHSANVGTYRLSVRRVTFADGSFWVAPQLTYD